MNGALSCPFLWNPMECSSPGSFVFGILQARILECVAIVFSSGNSWLRDWIQVSRISGRFFTIWAKWTTKNAEHERIDAFNFWCWITLLRSPWTARRANKSMLKEIKPEYSSEGLILQLKLQYFCHLMWRVNSLEKTLMLGKIEGRKRRKWQRMRWLNGITDSMAMSSSNCGR